MRLPTLQTLTWCTIAASIASALLLAGDGDQGLPLLGPRAEQARHPDADDRQARPGEQATPGVRNNGNAPAHSRRDERRRGPR
jgi:hypothetical protein